jgi:hypothetical protein
MSDITYRLTKGTELTFGELDRNFGSLDSDMVALSNRFDSFASARGLDSVRTIEIITDTVDSAYVELMYSKIDIFRDSNFVFGIVDSVLDSLGLKSAYNTQDHDSDTLVQVDSAYVRFRADSDYIQSAADSDHIKSIADSDYIHSAADSDHIKFIVDSDYIKFVADSSYVERIAEGVSGLDSQNVWDLLDGEARHLLPQSTETYDIGSNAQRWRDLYVRDAYISTTTIYLGTTDSPQRSSISVDSAGNFELASPASTGLIAISSTGSAMDSSAVLALIDSAYVQAREATGGGGLDSSSAIALIDSAYIQARQVDIDTVRDSAFVTSIVDAAYVQARQVDEDTVRDSGFVTGIIDSAYVQGRVTFPADQVGIDSATSISLTQSTVDSAYVQARVTFPADEVGIDSTQAISLIDSAYVQARVTFPADQVGLDSTQTTNLIDSAYVQARQIVGGSPWDSAKTTSIIDSAYIQARQVDVDTVRDSAFITGLVDERIDSTQFLATTATTTDVSEGDNLYYTTARHDSDTVAQVDSAYVQQRVRGPEMIAGGRFRTSAVFTQNGVTQKQLFGIFDSGQAPGGQDGIDKISDGRYVMRFDSANLNRISSGDDYTVMLTYDYSGDDPTASSRTLTVMRQDDSAFQIVLERSDAGTNEDYASGTAHINFQVWLY